MKTIEEYDPMFPLNNIMEEFKLTFKLFVKFLLWSTGINDLIHKVDEELKKRVND